MKSFEQKAEKDQSQLDDEQLVTNPTSEHANQEKNKSVSAGYEDEVLNQDHQDDIEKYNTQSAALLKMIQERKEKEEEEIRKGRIIKKEQVLKGVNLVSSFGRWIAAYGVVNFCLYILLLAMFNIGLIFFNWFLGKYSEGRFPEIEYKLVIILALSISFIFSLLGTIAHSIGNYNASVNIYSSLLRSILRRPMRFFDSTAIGQIISRLMSDKESIDNEIGFMIQILAFGVVQLVGIVAVVVSASPGVFIILLILVALFVAEFKKQILINTELKKMHTVAQAPIFSNISEVFNGASIVKSFQVEKKARKDFELNMDKQLTTAFHLETSGIYMELKCEQYGALLALFTALMISVMRIADIQVLLDKDTMALALSYVIIISNWVSSYIFSLSKFMKGIASYERVLSWIDSKDLEKMTKKKSDPTEEEWPKSGKIEGRNLTARYRPELPRVLKGLDFVI